MSAISREAEKKGIVQDILLEVNVAGEASKSGIAPENLPELLEKAGDFPGLRCADSWRYPRFAVSRTKIYRILILCISFLLTMAQKIR